MITVRQSPKWRVRSLIFVALIIPLYIVPSCARALLIGGPAWIVGILLSDILGSVVVGFLTNNYVLGLLLYTAATALELSLAALTHNVVLALFVGDLLPALIAIYFAQQLFINMGD